MVRGSEGIGAEETRAGEGWAGAGDLTRGADRPIQTSQTANATAPSVSASRTPGRDKRWIRAARIVMRQKDSAP